MQATWYDEPDSVLRYILAGDIGGTNANLAIVAQDEHEKLSTLVRLRHPSDEVTAASDLISEALSVIDARRPSLRPDLCCLCAAGPVEGNRCAPTNLDWVIDGEAISSAFGFPTLVLNDFQALCFGLPLLDVKDRDQVLPLPHPGGEHPEAKGSSWAVAGAGTGLGVGLLTRKGGKYVSLPSEGGHSLFAPFDDETQELRAYVARNYPTAPGTEPFLSGRGMSNIFNFYRDSGAIRITGEVLREIDTAPDHEKPPLITKHTPRSDECKRVMRLFIKIFARFAGTVALFFLPSSGMYIAGGIVVRHSALFAEEDLFIRHFEQSYKDNMQSILETIPVYIINDYSTSLIGSANAAVSIMTE